MHTTALCSPSRVVHADRPQPPLERDGVHHRGRDRLSRARTASSRSRTASCRRCCWRTATTRIALGKWHLTPDRAVQRRRPLRSLAARAAASSASTASWAATRSQYYPDLVYDNHQVEPPRDARAGLPPDRGSGRPRDRVHRRRQAGRARQAVLHVLLHRARCTRPTTCRASGPTSTRASSTTAGTPTARRCSSASSSWASCRRARSCPRAIPTSRRGTACGADEKRLYARMMEVFAGFLEHTDHHIGRLLAFLEKMRRARQHARSWSISDNGASAEGGPHGSVNENLFFNNVPETLEDNLKAIDELGGPEVLQPLPVGLGLGGQHAVPPLEARDLPRRRRRSVHRPLARRASRPRARCATSTRTSSTWCRRCWTRSASSRRPQIRGVTQSPIQGVSFAHAFDDAKAATPAPHAVLRDDGPPRRSITTAGARCARCRARRSPRRAWASARW